MTAQPVEWQPGDPIHPEHGCFARPMVEVFLDVYCREPDPGTAARWPTPFRGHEIGDVDE